MLSEWVYISRRGVAVFLLMAGITLAIAVGLHVAGRGFPAGTVLAGKPMTVKVAAVQCSSTFGDVEANRAKLTALVEQAASEGAKIIVLPEAAVTGYLSQDLRLNWRIEGRPIEPRFEGRDPASAAETVPGPSTRHFCQLAKRLGVYITVPFVEVVRGAKAEGKKDAGASTPATYFNTVCLVSPEGRIAAHYRKLTPWPYPEVSWATAGDRGVQAVDTEYGRVGLAICFDIHSILEKYKPRKIWALLYPIAWVEDTHPAEWFWHELPRRVAPYRHYLIGANWSVDRAQAWYGYGFSEIISPEGDVVAAAHSLYGSEIVYATIKTAWAIEQQDAAPKGAEMEKTK
ncbi:MAG: carbon-nitrogen hydrolase family protein [Planctomycetota bacterium]